MSEPLTCDIAIVGMSCRLPGGIDGPDALWSALLGGVDAVGEIGPERFSTELFGNPRTNEPGKSYTWRAGTVEGLESFDAEFFQISPREASQVDPQHRLLLELAVEALEDAGQPRARIAGSNTAVFVGISAMDFAGMRWGDLCAGNAYSVLGQAFSIAANRISYFLDLKGPSVAIDTACSSSMVALHLACRSLAAKEAPAALVGGVNVLLTPSPFIGFSNATMLSPEGKCRAFDADGRGYVRAEGAAVVMLKPLEAAQRDGDSIHAVIRATGSNADGRTTGLSMPSAVTQRALLETLYGGETFGPEDLVYVEAHGTGTGVGDPVEAQAIGEALGQRRSARYPLGIGSIKSNIGHLEPASGLAGLIKGTLVLKHGIIPPSLHFDEPNPNIDFDELNLRVVSRQTPIRENGSKPRRKNGRRPIVGVNSFGFGGTNAHAVLAAADAPAKPTASAVRAEPPLLLSAQRPAALRDMAARMADWLDGKDQGALYDAAWTRAKHRDALPCRLAVAGGTPDAVNERLNEFVREESERGIASGRADVTDGRLAFVFSGNGSQWLGMGATLLETSPVFLDAVRRVDHVFAPLSGWSIIEEMRNGESVAFDATEVAQPLLFALQIGVVASLLDSGVRADGIAGHSVGEVAAAHVAGALSLEDAVHVIFERSRAQAQSRGAGKMVVVGITEAEALADLEYLGLQLEIAGVNSPTTVVFSGPTDAVLRARDLYLDRDVFVRVLDLDYPFHSRFMDASRDQLMDSLTGISPVETSIPMVSTVTGDVVEGSDLDPTYWWRNIREPVRFADAISRLAAGGITTFLEIGPQPILQVVMRETLRSIGHTGAVLRSIGKRDADALRLQETALETWTTGCSLDLDRVFPQPGARVSLPAYPWQRERHWFQATPECQDLYGRPRLHPLLGYVVQRVEWTWENDLDLDVQTYLGDHVVLGTVLFPAAGFAELALAAATIYAEAVGAVEVVDLEIRSPLILEQGAARVLRTRIDADHGLWIESRNRLSDEDFTVHVVARLRPMSEHGHHVEMEPWRWPETGTEVGADEHYGRTAEVGLEYGEAFRTVDAVTVRHDTVFTRFVEAPEDAFLNAEFHLHPSQVDGSLQSLLDIAAGQENEGAESIPAYLPRRIGRIIMIAPDSAIAGSRARLTRRSPRSIVADIDLFDASGSPIARLENVRFQKAGHAGAALPPVYRVRAVPAAIPGADVTPIVDARHLADVAREALRETQERLAEKHGAGEAALLLDAAVAAFAEQALRDLGASDVPFSLDDLASAANVAPASQPLFRRLCEILAEDGVLAGSDDGLALAPSDGPSAAEVWRALIAAHPSYLAEAALVGRAGLSLTERLIVNGPEPDVLFDDSARSSLDHLTEASPSYAGVNAALFRMARDIVTSWPGHRPLRVVEIGAGTGRIARRVQAEFGTVPCDYVFTDPDEAALARARRELAGLPFIRYACMDIGNEASLEDLGEQGFDLAIAAHVLHRGEDVTAMLDRTRRLLRRGGLLIVVQRRAGRYSDLVFGSDPQWWRADSSGRSPASRLVSTRQWMVMLGNAGFTAPARVVGGDNEAGTGDAFVVVATRPTSDRLLIEETPETAPPQTATVLLMKAETGADEVGAGIASALRSRLEAQSATVVTVVDGPSFDDLGNHRYQVPFGERDDFRKLWFALGTEQFGACQVIDLSALEGVGLEPSDTAAAARERCLHVMSMVPPASAGGSSPRLRFEIVTRDAMVLSGRGQVDASGVWGMVRVLVNERPDVSFRLIDLQTSGRDDDAEAGLLATELADGHDETEVLLTDAGRMALRVGSNNQASDGFDGAADEGAQRRRAFVLTQPKPGALDGLEWRERSRQTPGPGQVEVRVRAAGLNFRDVMWAMGLLPDEAVEDGYAGPTLGIECAGEVVAVGPGVDHLREGDPVVSFASACFADHVTTDAATVFPMPVGLSFAEAATVPTAFFTAYYALSELGRLRAGESVLIHGGAGGVGLAAIQYAKACGAVVFATAGSDEKRDFLQLIGVDHVLGSRTLAFADEVMDVTGGAGVDVVLNCLAGDAMRRSLDLLKPFGRFLELGKRDLFADSRIGLRALRRNISYFAIDADQIVRDRSALAVSLFDGVMQCFADSVFRPLPLRAFGADEVSEAFRHMQQSHHIGKIIVDLDLPPRRIVPAPAAKPALQLDPKALYLIAGGLGGFGLETARWLADKGARHLALVGRRAKIPADAKDALAELAARGVSVRTEACDIADSKAVAQLFKTLENGPRVDGIIHAAMVLNDGLASDLDAERLATVFRPKVDGALNLDEASRDLNLRFFVIYSSATTLFGNPGQAAYVAANTVLEQLARNRRANGLPATCIAWGPIGDAGYLARNETVRDALARRLGGRTLTAKRALAGLERMIMDDVSDVTVVDLDWRIIRRGLPAASARKFSDVYRGLDDSSQDTGDSESLRAQFAGRSAEDIIDELRKVLIDRVAAVLRLPPERVEPARPLIESGMDSLMGLELGMALEKDLGITLPPFSLGERTSIDTLAPDIARRVATAGPMVEAAAETDAVVSVLFEQHVVGTDQKEMEELAETVDASEIRGSRLLK